MAPYTRPAPSLLQRIWYQVHGNQSEAAETVVLIRGHASQLIQWPSTFLDAFLERYRVVLLDNRDSGASTSTVETARLAMPVEDMIMDPPFTMFDMAGDVISVMDCVGVERAHIVGLSMGGLVAQFLAVCHRNRVLSGTTLMSFSTHCSQLLPHKSDVVLDHELNVGVPDDTNPASVAAYFKAGFKAYGSTSPEYQFDEDHAESLAMEVALRQKMPYNACERRQMAAMIASCEMVNIERCAARIRHPWLVLHGEDDGLINVRFGRQSAALIPGAELEIIPGMAHEMNPRLGSIVGARVASFLRRASRGTTMPHRHVPVYDG